MNEAQTLDLFVTAFVDELARSGVRDVCLAPGSRSTPLAVACAADRRLKTWMHIDERAAAFFALGMAKASGRPVALVCTSGTAAAEFLPAVAEALHGRAPLLVLTADRPHELRDAGAPQTLDQVRLYGVHVKWFFDFPPPEASPEALALARSAAGRAAAVAAASPPGPVHLNFPFREPLVPQAADEAGFESVPPYTGRPGGRPYVRHLQGRRMLPREDLEILAEELAAAERGLIVCGPQDDPGLAEAVSALAGLLGWPVVADALSQLRCGPHDRSRLIAAHDAILRAPAAQRRLQPDFILQFGAPPTSKALQAYLAGAPCRRALVDGGDGWRDPARTATDMLHVEPAAFCRELAEVLGPGAKGEVNRWSALWRRLDDAAARALFDGACALDELFEGRVFLELGKLLPPDALLFAGNSMPVRDLDSFLLPRPQPLRLMANRGVNGIDGVTSTALGAAAAVEGPVALATGDLSFYHDLNGLLAAHRHGLDLTVVLIDNDGGGIFSFLPQAERVEAFEELFGTPLGIDLAAAAAPFGGQTATISDWEEFKAAVGEALAAGGLRIVRVPTDRRRNAEMHQALWKAAARAVEAALAGDDAP